MNDYNNVFHPRFCGDSWESKELELEVKTLPVDKLIERRAEYETRLMEARMKEPARKRYNKSEYRIWIQHTHDLLDCIELITKELSLR